MRALVGLCIGAAVLAVACGSDLDESKKAPLPASLDVRIDGCQILLMDDAAKFLDEKVLSYGYGLSASTCLYTDAGGARHLELTIFDSDSADSAHEQFVSERAGAEKAAEVKSVETVTGLGDEAYRVLAKDESGADVTFVVYRTGAIGAALMAKKPGASDLSVDLEKLAATVKTRLDAVPAKGSTATSSAVASATPK